MRVVFLFKRYVAEIAGELSRGDQAPARVYNIYAHFPSSNSFWQAR